jgi:hypothetical protein
MLRQFVELNLAAAMITFFTDQQQDTTFIPGTLLQQVQ